MGIARLFGIWVKADNFNVPRSDKSAETQTAKGHILSAPVSKNSIPAILRGGSRQTTARLVTCLETLPFAFVQWNTEILPLKEADSGNVTRSWQTVK